MAWVGQAVTAVAGSSEWFDRGYVTYSNAAKQEMLGVSAGTLERHGAVSEETAREMAAGALARSGGTISVSITGVAGPGGGTAAKPVGLVCFGWAHKGRVVADPSLRRRSRQRAPAGRAARAAGRHRAP